MVRLSLRAAVLVGFLATPALAKAPRPPKSTGRAATKFVALKPDKPKSKRVKQPPDPMGSCTKALKARKVAFKPATRLGIAHAVEVSGPLGGVVWQSAGSATGQTLVIDCSLAISLDEAGRYLRAAGIDKALFSSAYSRRNVRGSGRPSKHSYGLAIDVSAYAGRELGTIRVDRDYEQGLGDGADCVGLPLTRGGSALKVMQCQLARSGLFHLVLSPDYDDAHHDHFHLEVKPWAQRTELRSQALAIH